MSSLHVLHVALVGPGLVGRRVLRCLHALPVQSIRLVALMSSSRLWAVPTDVDPQSTDVTSLPSVAASDDAFCAMLEKCLRPLCIVDCTASDDVAVCYTRWLELACHIVTPNKKAFSGACQLYRNIAACSHPQMHGAPLVYHESTVGAGLPILSTLRDLIDAGERVISIEGVLSGTLSYIFNHYSATSSTSTTMSPARFSDILRKAKENGFTEPDPRDDLNGMDVARKVIILARILLAANATNSTLPSLNDVTLEQLVPHHLLALPTIDEFMTHLEELDVHIDALSSAKLSQATGPTQNVLRMVGTVDPTQATVSVQLKPYPITHPFATLTGSDNMIIITTENAYPSGNPLVIRGPGAGAEATALGVVSDLMRVWRTLNYPSKPPYF